MKSKTEVKVLEAKMVVVDGKQVPCTVYSPARPDGKTKMKLRGKQTHNMNLDTNRWSRGI